MRVVRLLRLAKSSARLQGLLKTLWMSVANISYVGMLILLMFFVFTLTGMDLFGKITQGPEGFINDDCNFQTFYNGMMVMARASTGESWNGIMHDLFLPDSNNVLPRLFWITFILINFFVFINVMVAIIFDQYLEVTNGEKYSTELTVTLTMIRNFNEVWA
jgi:hypothetical protein